MTDAEIYALAKHHIKWVEPQHALFYDDALLSFARAILAAQLAAPVAPKGGERHKVPCTSRDAICAQPAYCHRNGCKEPAQGERQP
jgi:hypothetical protein